MTTDFSLLPDCICLEIFSYLPNQDQIAFVSTKPDFYAEWIQKLRVFELHGPLSELFLINTEFRNKILTKISNPLTQLSLRNQPLSKANERCTIEEIDQSFHVSPGLHRLEIDGELFEYLMRKPDCHGIEEVEHLLVTGCLEGREYAGYIQDGWTITDSFASHFKKATKSLFLEALIIDSSLEECLSPSLTELVLSYNAGNIVLPPHLPNLRKLTIIETLVANLSQFHYVNELYLCHILIHDLSCFQNIANLTLQDCGGFTNLTSLQDNCNIKIQTCPDLINYMGCLHNSKVIAIRFPEEIMDIRFDLSDYTSMETLRIDFNKCKLSNFQIFSLISQTLKYVTLENLGFSIDLNLFQLVEKIALNNCRGIKSLEGLADVKTVCLIRLEVLTSLEGLGRNKEVEVIDCLEITDFSSVRSVLRVLIQNCKGFTNAENVADVNELIIVDCDELTDITPLTRVRNLTLDSCPKIRSIKSLQSAVPIIQVKNCKNLRMYEAPHFDLKNRMVKTSNGLGWIPDSVYGALLEFLEYEEKIQFVCTNAYLYESLMKKTRNIVIYHADRLELFLRDENFFSEILEKMENPLKQLQVIPPAPYRFTLATDTVLGIESFLMRNNFYCPGYQKLEAFIKFFKNLCDREVDLNSSSSSSSSCSLSSSDSPGLVSGKNEWKVNHLILRNDGFWNDDSAFEEIQPYLSKVISKLKISVAANMTNLEHLSPSLEELCVGRSPGTVVSLPFLPKLRILSISSCTIENLAEFHYLQKLTLDDIAITDVTPFQTIESITFTRCNQLQEISPLQSHRFIELNSCAQLRDYRYALTRCKEIKIDCSNIAAGELWIDLSHFQCVEIMKLTCKQLVTVSDGLPSSLREITITEKIRFDDNFNGFQGLQRVVMEDCSFVSLERFKLDSVREVVLTRLYHLTSLEGLIQQTSTESVVLRSVVIDDCPKITDFSPLNYFHKVTIMNCDGFRNGAEVDHVHELLIENCSNLRDISMLRNIPKLGIKDCRRLVARENDYTKAFERIFT